MDNIIKIDDFILIGPQLGYIMNRGYLVIPLSLNYKFLRIINDSHKNLYMQQAVKGELWRLRDPQGKPPGVMGWWPSRAVTFLDNHDTGSTQVHTCLFGDVKYPHFPFHRNSTTQVSCSLSSHSCLKRHFFFAGALAFPGKSYYGGI